MTSFPLGDYSSSSDSLSFSYHSFLYYLRTYIFLSFCCFYTPTALEYIVGQRHFQVCEFKKMFILIANPTDTLKSLVRYFSSCAISSSWVVSILTCRELKYWLVLKQRDIHTRSLRKMKGFWSSMVHLILIDSQKDQLFQDISINGSFPLLLRS